MRSLSYHPNVPAEVREILAYCQGISQILADDFWVGLTEALEYAREFPTRRSSVGE
jgi:hypothetical protein